MYLSSDDGTLSASGGAQLSGQYESVHSDPYNGYDSGNVDSGNSGNIYSTTPDMSGHIYSSTPPMSSANMNFSSGGPQPYFGARFLGHEQMYSTAHGRLAGTPSIFTIN